MKLEKIIEALKVRYLEHDNLDEMVDDLSRKSSFDHWAKRLCDKDKFDQGQDLGRALFKRSLKVADSCDDYRSLAENVLNSLDDKEWAKEIFQKAEGKASDADDYQSLAESILDEDYLGDKAWAKRLYEKAESMCDKYVIDKKKVDINAAWEISEEDSTCRWFLAWKKVDDGIAGVVSGYSGGGCFQDERFYCKYDHSSGEVLSLCIDYTDHITGEEIEFEELGENIIDACAAASVVKWEWNDEDEWCDDDRIILMDSKADGLQKRGDMLYLEQGEPLPFLRSICEYAGLTSAPFAIDNNSSMSNNSSDNEAMSSSLDLKGLEGADEVFVDTLEDIGVFDMSKGQSIDFGENSNIFTCTNVVTTKEDDDSLVKNIFIKANFYEVPDPVNIKIIKYYSDVNDLECHDDLEVFWQDAFGNFVPSEHPEWLDILENMEIFLDEL